MGAENAVGRIMASQGDPLLTSKFRADEIRPGPIIRPRLFELLDVAARSPLTLVTAPAGAGKTTLVGSWVAAGRAPGRVGWISLDPGDHRPEIFWSYVLEGLARSEVELSGIGPTVVGGRAVGSLLARLSACLADQPVPTVLILDNIEQLGRGPVAEEIGFLIRHTIPRLRVIVIGRAAAPLPLHHYRLAGWVSRIDADDLAFSTTEMRAMLAAHGVRIPDSGVTVLAERTRGWAAGIRLAALALRDKPAAEAARIVARFDGSRPEVAEYLVAEVLDRWPSVVRRFLLRTSVVDTLHPDLAATLTGRHDSASMLFALVRANAFVTVSEDGMYHYHPLLRSVLRSYLDREPAEVVTGLHRDAARWFAAAGQPATAVRHAVAAGDWAWAAELVVEHLVFVRLLVGSDAARFRTLFADMPDSVEGAAPEVIRALLAIAGDDAEAGADHLSRASVLAGGPGPSATGCGPIRLAVDVVRTLLCALRLDVVGTVSAATAVEASAAELAARGCPLPPDPRAAVLAAKGGALLWSGDLGGADGALVAASRAADEAGLDHLKMRVLGQLALLNAIRGRLRQATRFGRFAVNLAERLGLREQNRPPVIDAAFAWIAADSYDIPAARRHLRGNRAADDPLTAAANAVVQARLRHDAGPARVGWPGTIEPPPWLAAHVGQPDRHGTTTLAAQVEMWLDTAARELDHGRTQPAARALGHALKLAEPEGLRRPIVEAPAGLRRLLRNDPELSGRHHWLGAEMTGTAAAAPADQPCRPILVEPLTNREHEVLRNMAALLSTDEIAGAMFVSVNTVKTHVRGILRKLSVNRRNDAIRRARELGLV